GSPRAPPDPPASSAGIAGDADAIAAGRWPRRCRRRSPPVPLAAPAAERWSSAVPLVVDESVAELHLDQRDDHDDHEQQPGHGGGEAEVELPERLLEQI